MHDLRHLPWHRLAILVLAAALTVLAGCDDDGDADPNPDMTADTITGDMTTGDTTGGDTSTGDMTGDTTEPGTPTTYTFESAFVPGTSSIDYAGQIGRQVLILDLSSYIASLTDQIDAGTFMPSAEGDVVAALDFYFRFDGDSNGDEPFGLSIDGTLLQSTYNDITSGRDLVSKLAGNDTATDHKDFSSAFDGWQDATLAQHGGSIDSPEGFVTAIFETLEAHAIDRANGTLRTGPDGETLPVHVTASGVDLEELTQKFLYGGINLSQGGDDYLDDDVDGKGLLASNAAPDDGAYTDLEHAWDEGFGYFGSARALDQFTDAEIIDPRYKDIDGDGAIDLTSEYNFGVARYAAQRDAAAAVATDFTHDAWDAFLAGRALIAANAGTELTDAQLDELRGYRDQALFAWEAALGATTVHYLNDTLKDMNAFGGDEYEFLRHAAHWSEMKGFALGLQFNPHSPLTDAQFTELHALIGDAPVLADAEAGDIDQYRTDLLAARQILQDAYGFDAANVGDDNGENGW